MAAARDNRGGLARQLRQRAVGFQAPQQHTTTLVNDTVHPFSPRELARLQSWADRSKIPTLAGNVTVAKGGDPTIGEGAAGDHYIAFSTMPRRFALYHELGHESQMFSGPGGSIISAAGNYGGGQSGWSDQKIGGLSKLLGIPTTRYQNEDATRPLEEVAADAYAEAALRGSKWRQWWGQHGANATSWNSTATTYDFRAMPKRWAAILKVLQGL